MAVKNMMCGLAAVLAGTLALASVEKVGASIKAAA
jgi:hypothetical protein